MSERTGNLFNVVLDINKYHILDEEFNMCQGTKLYFKVERRYLSKWFVNPVAARFDNPHYTLVIEFAGILRRFVQRSSNRPRIAERNE
jgi:hypothetical protein